MQIANRKSQIVNHKIFLLFTFYFALLCTFGCKKNQAPEPPTVPCSTAKSSASIDSGWVDSTYWFFTSAEDPENENVFCMFDWGDDSVSPWSNEVTSGATIKMSHSYTETGNYRVKARAKDIHKNESEWSESRLVVVSSKSPAPYNVEIVSVPESVIVLKPQTFEIQGWDSSLADSIRYQCRFIGFKVDTASDTTKFVDSTVWSILGDAGGWYESGAVGEIQFTFQDTGTYIIIPRAKDKSGSLSSFPPENWKLDSLLNWETSRTGKIYPPRVPYTPELKKYALHLPHSDEYRPYLSQTPYHFSAALNSLVEGDTSVKFEYAWGDEDTVLTLPESYNPVYIILSHAYETQELQQSFNVTVRAQDKWGQFSSPSIPVPITITNNFLKDWKIDLMDTTAHAYGIAIWGDSVYVVDNYNHEVKIFSKDGDLLDAIGTNNLEAPMYVAVDSEFVYVTDAYNTWEKANKVYKFKKDGSLVTSWGGLGRDRGEFDFPTGIAVDTGYVYVMDHNNERIQKFTKAGVYLTDWNCPKSRGIAIDGGNLYSASYTENYILVFNTNGIQTSSIGLKGSNDGELLSPQDIAIYGDTVYVVEAGNSRVQKLTKAGAFVTRWGCVGGETGQFKNPYGIAIDNEGNVYVVDTGNRRIQKFDGSVF